MRMGVLYTVLIDGEPGAYGAVFPDLPGCTAMGATMEETLVNAAGAATTWARVTEAHGGTVRPPRSIAELRADPDVEADIRATDAILGVVPLIRDKGETVKANLTLPKGVLEAIDAVAKRTGRTRSATVETLAQVGLPLIG
ncbi:MAG: type II toxin-antitoxin system HicB family antitoxin [Caulobacteraceae bacterium]|nr:type II toxin-antitoxin system HicB family antitoxin [Caulobacter sp.]